LEKSKVGVSISSKKYIFYQKQPHNFFVKKASVESCNPALINKIKYSMGKVAQQVLQKHKRHMRTTKEESRRLAHTLDSATFSKILIPEITKKSTL